MIPDGLNGLAIFFSWLNVQFNLEMHHNMEVKWLEINISGLTKYNMTQIPLSDLPALMAAGSGPEQMSSTMKEFSSQEVLRLV